MVETTQQRQPPPTRPHGALCSLLPGLWVGLLCGLLCGEGLAAPKGCTALIRSKRYALAAHCFAKAARALLPPKGTKLDEKQRVRVGRYLRNAAIGYRMAAQKSSKPEQASYYRQLAIGALQTYIKRRLYEHIRRRNSALALQQQLQKKLGLTPLAVIAHHSKARIVLRGYRFRKAAVGRWLGAVRPGRYTAKIRYPGEAAGVVKEVIVRAGKPALLEARPRLRPRNPSRRLSSRRPAQRPQMPRPNAASRGLWIAGWVLLAAGAAAALAGGLTYGIARNAEARKLELKPETATLSDTQERIRLHQLSAQLTPAGSAILWSGGGLMALGGAFLLIHTLSTPPRPPAKAK